MAATKNLVNLFIRLHEKVDPRPSKETPQPESFWTHRKGFQTRIPDTLGEATLVADALSGLADANYVAIPVVKGEQSLTEIVDELHKALKASRSPINEAGIEALIHKVNKVRFEANRIAKRKGLDHVEVEVVAWVRS